MKELYQRGHSLKTEVRKMLIFIHLDMETDGRCIIPVIMKADMEKKAKQRTLLGLSLYSHKQNKEVTVVNTVSVHTMKAYRGEQRNSPTHSEPRP
jgi:hypothetical protein